ncbi:MAG: hypothetical protein BZY79_00410 [SAR202 cluster bacterium Casp-Chloro-G4]|nr:alpha/beta hydrolase domain-containing protein [Chloroflexota bacterium]MDA1226900.1 alpha/beta hydrolase domain-containing protein [Chloroflexota bacterium]PKB62064.1 MAG: hypothetical protein BZY79_00410 [SAR202 cluster bacterium Casp-Chloro-G4]
MRSQVRLNIQSPKPFADGMAFGDVGPYEAIEGSVDFAIDPNDLANAGIVDLKQAPRNAEGLVEYSTEFYILRPVDLERGNGRLIYDVNNRGNKRILQFFNDGVHSNTPITAENAGNGFLMRRGYSIVWSGWQGDVLPIDSQLSMRLPVATNNGVSITGDVRTEFIIETQGVQCRPLSAADYADSYQAANTDTTLATFTMREYPYDEKIVIPSDQWSFSQLGTDGKLTESAKHVYLANGFRPGWIYDLIYTAKDPKVMGLGLSGLRDLTSFLMHDGQDENGVPNPLRQGETGMDKAYAWGRSQSGRFLREFVYRGFNQACDGSRVFDAMSPHVAGGGRIVLNYRFAQPDRFPRQHFHHTYPCDQFPFSYAESTDALTGETDAILKRPETDPLIIHTQTSAEYWERRASLSHTDSLGNDLPQPENVRIFCFAGSQHSADPLAKGPSQGNHQYPSNPLNTSPLLRALLDALDAWATDGTTPPDSRVPSRSNETAVPADVAKANFPNVPGVTHPVNANRLFAQDHGPDFNKGIIAEPPREDVSKEYQILVPQVDADGNELPGIRTPQIQVPLATYTGWNYRPVGSAEKSLAGLVGSYLPFARTKAERDETGDHRPSLEERYGSKETYVKAIEKAAQSLVQQRLLLQEDAERYVALARAQTVFD